MLSKTLRKLQQKKNTGATFMASAGKTGSEEKWAQAAMEFIYEKVQTNDGKKRQADVEQERAMGVAFDRYLAKNEAVYSVRLENLTKRTVQALESIPQELLDEALLLNSAQPPLNYNRPALTPPIPGYEPGFGIDVPQLRTDYPEYPKVVRPTDHIEFGEEPEQQFPFVDPTTMLNFTSKYKDKMEAWHGSIRQEAPVTGPEGEQWEAYVALNKKAVARQKLILELCNDPDMKEKYDNDEEYRNYELSKRRIVSLDMGGSEKSLDAPRSVPTPAKAPHYAQEAKYHPFRKM